MAKKRINPSYKTKVQLLQEVHFRCPFCFLTDSSILEHHHIDGNPSNTQIENLISVCPNCHTKIESGLITNDKVLATKSQLSSQTKDFYSNSYTFDNFRIHSDRIGIFKKGMTIRDVILILPSNQVRKTIVYGEHDGEDLYDSYEIYNSDGEHLLSLQTSSDGNLNSQIEFISIKSNKFHTVTNLSIGCKFSDILDFENIRIFGPDIDHIYFEVEWIGASCFINKIELIDNWWDEENEEVFIEGQNLESHIEAITIFWRNI